MNGNEYWSSRELKILLLSMLLAIFGGFAKLFTTHKQLTVYHFISYCIVSGFTGVMASYLVRYLGLPPLLQNFFIGMSGFAAPTTLSAFTALYEKRLGIEIKRTVPGEESEKP